MQYQGGKAPESRYIGPLINELRGPNQPYWEPFVGAGSVLARVEDRGVQWASDVHPQLIAMWQALTRGWRPPLDGVSEEQYAAAKQGELSPELTGFIGFGCSWGGKWFGGYARNNKGVTSYDYSRGSARSLVAKFEKMPPAVFHCCSYEDPKLLPQSFIYCDPPYEGRTAYKTAKPFSHEAFWQWVRDRQAEGHDILVSSFEAPDDFYSILNIPAATETRNSGGRCIETEKVFVHRDSRLAADPWR